MAIDLADDADGVRNFAAYDESYYAATKHFEAKAGANFISDSFTQVLIDTFTFMAENEGIYGIFCVEGKDRTGYVAALLECLCGASYEEVVSDYMITYYNYYGIGRNDQRYDVILNKNIRLLLETVFDVPDLSKADLQQECEDYLKEIGLSSATLEKLKHNLAIDHAEY